MPGVYIRVASSRLQARFCTGGQVLVAASVLAANDLYEVAMLCMWG